MNWLTYALLGMFFIALMSLIFKKLTLENLQAEIILLFLFGFAFLFYLGQVIVTKTPVKLNYFLIILLILAAFFSYIGNLFQVKSIGLAPNPAYSIAIISSQTILVAIGSYFLYNSQISIMNAIGILLGIVAIVLLSL